jgi:hypothetical protein
MDRNELLANHGIENSDNIDIYSNCEIGDQLAYLVADESKGIWCVISNSGVSKWENEPFPEGQWCML